MAASVPPSLSALFEASDHDGREQAWAAFLRQYSGLVLKAIRRASSGYDEAMDRYAFALDQLRADDFRRLRVFQADRRAKFTTWLVIVVRRLCVDHHRHRYGRPQARNPEAPAHATERLVRRRLVDLMADEVNVETVHTEGGETPEAGLVAQEKREALSAALGALSPRDQLLVTLRFGDGLSVRKIAPLLGYPTPFHVYRRQSAILGILRCALEKRGVTEP